jgi:hypothetical protein
MKNNVFPKSHSGAPSSAQYPLTNRVFLKPHDTNNKKIL